MWYIYTTEYYIAIRNDAITQFAATWMEMKEIVLNEVSQKDKYRMIPLICDITA